jgi:hypothetical protein
LRFDKRAQQGEVIEGVFVTVFVWELDDGGKAA